MLLRTRTDKDILSGSILMQSANIIRRFLGMIWKWKIRYLGTLF